MEKLTLIIVLVAIAFILVAAMRGKNILEFIRNARQKLRGRLTFKFASPPEEAIKDKTSKAYDENMPIDAVHTITMAALYMYELDSMGESIYRHDIKLKDLTDDNGNMVGVSVSRPCANVDGIKLCGKPNKDGLFNKKDPSLTVNTEAIAIGRDEKGFYGKVTHPESQVYIVDANKKMVIVPFGKSFPIEDGTYVLVGYQWLYFTLPKLPDILNIHKADASASASAAPTVPEFVREAKKGIGKRDDVADTKTFNSKLSEPTKKPKTVNYSFPMEVNNQ